MIKGEPEQITAKEPEPSTEDKERAA